MNISNAYARNKTLFLVVSVSLGLHILGLIIFGAYKVVESIAREEQSFEMPPVAEALREQPDFNLDLEQRNRSSAPRPNPIVVDLPDPSANLPALDIDLNVASASSYGRGGGGFGAGSMVEMREMAINTATLFGVEVSARKLGVILDVSFSTHRNIELVLEEIDKNFEDAIIMFVPGCKMGREAIDIYPLSEYDAAGEKYQATSDFWTKGFLDRLLERGSFKDIWKELMREGRGYAVFAVGNQGPRIGGVGEAMEFLRGEGVEAIYWFADYQDEIRWDKFDEVLEGLKRSRVSLIMHDFVEPLGPNSGGNKEGGGDTSKVNRLLKIAEDTNGKFFLKVL